MAAPLFGFDNDDDLSLVNVTAVAVDKDKNSHAAVRWAVDHLLTSNPFLVMLHIRHKNHQHQVLTGDDGDSGEAKEIFMPCRAFCLRKGVKFKEVVLDDVDISRAIIDFISSKLIRAIVVGAATRNALASLHRKFKSQDVPTSLMKHAPDFCSVYVISKGKILQAREAIRNLPNTALPPRALSLPPPDYSTEHEGPIRAQTRKGARTSRSTRSSFEGPYQYERNRNHTSNASMDSVDISFVGSRNSTSRDSMSDDSDLSEVTDLASNRLDVSVSSSSSAPAHQDMEAEMRRLKLELKHTMELYSTACKEALSAKQKANELDQWKKEEARRIEEAKLAEEAALAVAEMEKAKCRAAMEAAEKAQRIAEIEAQKRKHAEIKAKREAEEKARAWNALTQNDVRYRKYTIEEIEEGTQKFSPSMRIGEGGYGPVYKGKLDHTPVAIKVLRPDAAQGKKQFQQEVEVLCTIRHPNMVLLLGACPEYGCLVYEYMDNGSLEDRLLRRNNTAPLSWRKRFFIAAEIATTLLFLHQAKPEPLVHRDLKPANILLDRNYVSKISDVGLSRLVPASVANSVTQYHMTSAAGTFCYIDPEYQQTGMLTTKSDIYSLGIVLLQIITSKPPMGLAHHVGRSIEKGTFAQMLDQAVKHWPVEEALCFAKLALKCCELRKKDRPSLADVVVPELNRLRDLVMNNEPEPFSSHSDADSSEKRSRSRSCSPLARSSVPGSSHEWLSSASQEITRETNHVGTEGHSTPN